MLVIPTATAATTTAATALLGLILTFDLRCLFRDHLGLFDVINVRHDRGIHRHHRSGFRNHARGGLELLDRVIRRDQEGIGFDPDRHAVTCFDLRDMFALVVHQEVHDADRRLHQHLTRPTAHAFFFQLTQDVQGKVVVRADQAGAVAVVARLGRRLDHAGTQTLTAHFHQTKARDAAHLNARAVGLQLVLHPLFNGVVVATLVHVDEVDHDQARKVAQTQLACDLFRGLKVGLQRRFLDRAFLSGPARVHVDGNQCLGYTDHDIATGLQLNGRVKHARQIAFDLIAREQRHGVLVVLHVLSMGRHDHFHEVLGHAIAGFAFYKHFVDLT